MSVSRLATSAAIAVHLPLPPGCLPTLQKNDDGFLDSLSVGVPLLLPDGRCRGLYALSGAILLGVVIGLNTRRGLS